MPLSQSLSSPLDLFQHCNGRLLAEFGTGHIPATGTAAAGQCSGSKKPHFLCPDASSWSMEPTPDEAKCTTFQKALSCLPSGAGSCSRRKDRSPGLSLGSMVSSESSSSLSPSCWRTSGHLLLAGPQTAIGEPCPLASLEGFCPDPCVVKLLVLSLQTLPPKHPPTMQESFSS